MADLGPEDVRRLAEALALPLAGEDAAEIAHRLNAFLDALAALDALPLEEVEPWPTRAEGIA
jgi:Asp-tRNA(Asn)/Glu-tRNA(Gln) amidotransferase C subunit